MVENAEKYLQAYDAINFSIITYYEILNGLLFKDARKQFQKFTDFADLNNILPLTISATKRRLKFMPISERQDNLSVTLIA